MNRRTIVKGAAGAAAAQSLAFAAGSASRVIGANDTIRVAVLGVNGRGQSHFNGFQPLKNVQVTTFCDPDLDIANQRASEFEAKHGHRPAVVQDLRKVMEDKDIDVISIAMPNHWHTLAAIWACQNGKDVYVEKPATHTLAEGRSLIAAAKKYNRIVQNGVQLRSSEAVQEAVQKMRDGVIGDVYMARATIFKWRPPLKDGPNEKPPKNIDYDLWVGPGKYRPYSKRHVHYNWHWTWDFGNGEIGNQGIHETDMLQWGLDVKFPTKVSTMGGKFLWDDWRETPELTTTMMEYGPQKKWAEIAVRFWCSNNEANGSNANLFYGSEGYLQINGYTNYEIFFGRKREPGPTGKAPTRHFENFIKAVRSRKTEDQNGPVETAHYSAGLAHIGLSAYRAGGGVFEFDPEAEKFIGHGAEKPNSFLDHPYRKGFEVPAPDKV